MTLRVVIVESLSSFPQNTVEAKWLVKLTDSLADHYDLGSFHAIPTFDATLSDFSEHANQPMNVN